ncbi:MAG: protoporphyrinogen oxidase [Pseudanabaena sp. ELA607]
MSDNSLTNSHSDSLIDTLVIGGGITGLSVAYGLHKQGRTAVIAEAGERVGGAITSKSNDEGFLWEEGPNSFMPTTELLEVATAVGLAPQLLLADGKLPRFVYWNRQLQAIPMSPPSAITTKLLSWGGKIRLALGAMGFAKPAMAGEESVAQFFRRQLGSEALERLVSPFVSGVYAGDPAELSAQSAFGRIVRLETNYGGLLAGAILSRKQAKKTNSPAKTNPNLPKVKPGQLGSFPKGIQMLPEAMAAQLQASGHQINLHWRLTEIKTLTQGGYVTTFSTPDGEKTIQSRNLVLTTPAYITAQLLQDLAPQASQALSEIPYPPVACVVLAYPKKNFKQELNGFGNLILRGQGVRTLGTIWASTLFPNRAPQGWNLLLNFIGGTTDPAIGQMTEAEIVAAVDQDLRQTLLKPDAPSPKVVALHLWQKAIPQYSLGHEQRLQTIAADLSRHPGLKVCGNFIGGVALGDCIKNGLAIAESL